MLCHRLRRGGVVYEFAYRTHVSAAANSLTIPNDVDETDLLVFINFRSCTSGTVSDVLPAGFTAIDSAANGVTRHRLSASMKIASTSDRGQTVTGMSTGTGTVVDQSILLVLRGNRRITTISSGRNAAAFADFSDAAQFGGIPIPSGSGTPPLCAMIFYRQDSVTSQSFSPTADNTITQGTLTARLKFYNTAPANVSGSQGDGGNMNGLGGCWVGVS